MKVFVSYCHAQGAWVLDRLVPCLKAGGAEVLIDRERFRAGGGVYHQMDATQDEAERHVLVVSAEYLASRACQHEMQRAIDLDPTFAKYIVLPVRRDDTSLPDPIKVPDPLYVDLRVDTKPAPWALLLRECGGTLGATVPDWLTARDEIRRKLDDHRSVNFIVSPGVKWRELIEDVTNRPGKSFPLIYMNAGEAVARRSLIATILGAIGAPSNVPRPPEDLAALSRAIGARAFTTLGLLNLALIALLVDMARAR
jgi:hypothetical protein